MSRKPKLRVRNTTADLPAHLLPGAKVEVCSDEPGFHGSWFAGTVMEPSQADSSKILVMYTDLVEEGTLKLLRQECDVANLRPEAPRENSRKFRFGETVDAWSDNGWWEGVIVKDLDLGNVFGDQNRRFQVFLRPSGEQNVFGDEDLRLHRDWIDGSWIPPLEDDTTNNGAEDNKLPMSGKNFLEETRVEVRRDEEDGFKGALFAANIVNYVVQYESLRTNNGKEFLKEEVDAARIRPYPPRVVGSRYKMFELVDALHNFGWREGRINRILNETECMVRLKGFPFEQKFKQSDLRLHQDWIDGKWTTTPSQRVRFEEDQLQLSPSVKTDNVLRATAGSSPSVKTGIVLRSTVGTRLRVPEAVLSRKAVKKGDKAETVWLIQWQGGSVEEATWESKDEMLQRYPDFNFM